MAIKAHIDTTEAKRQLEELIALARRSRSAGASRRDGELDPAKVAQANRRYARRNGDTT